MNSCRKCTSTIRASIQGKPQVKQKEFQKTGTAASTIKGQKRSVYNQRTNDTVLTAAARWHILLFAPLDVGREALSSPPRRLCSLVDWFPMLAVFLYLYVDIDLFISMDYLSLILGWYDAFRRSAVDCMRWEFPQIRHMDSAAG